MSPLTLIPMRRMARDRDAHALWDVGPIGERVAALLRDDAVEGD